MSFLTAFPTVEVRLARSQHELIAPGFQRIADLHDCYLANGLKPIFSIHRLSPRPQSIKGKYDQAIMAALLELGKKLDACFSTPYASSRLRLTHLEIEFLIFGARVTRKQAQHSHICAPGSYSEEKIKLLLKWLEARRKRAKRCWIASTGRDAYQSVQTRWSKLMEWIHHDLLYCTCKRMPSTGVRRRQRSYIKHVISLGRKVLVREALPIPEDAHMNHLARAFLHNVRRQYNKRFRSFLSWDSWVETEFAEYLRPRVRKSVETIDASNR